MPTLPRVALLCHEEAPIDAVGLASWMATRFELVALITIRPSRQRFWRAVRREWRRSGTSGLLDVLALRLGYRLLRGGADHAWIDAEIARLRGRYPASLERVPRLSVESPNDPSVKAFLLEHRADAAIARLKVILKPETFSTPRAGTFVLHPGICPEYRNAHGCFWALAENDLGRVGMTMLQIDRGVDTGPVFLQASYPFDELRESHLVIQHRVVLENLDRIGDTLEAAIADRAQPISTAGRASAVWGQPTLSAFLRWRRAARARALHAARIPSLP